MNMKAASGFLLTGIRVLCSNQGKLEAKLDAKETSDDLLSMENSNAEQKGELEMPPPCKKQKLDAEVWNFVLLCLILYGKE